MEWITNWVNQIRFIDHISYYWRWGLKCDFYRYSPSHHGSPYRIKRLIVKMRSRVCYLKCMYAVFCLFWKLVSYLFRKIKHCEKSKWSNHTFSMKLLTSIRHVFCTSHLSFRKCDHLLLYNFYIIDCETECDTRMFLCNKVICKFWWMISNAS